MPVKLATRRGKKKEELNLPDALINLDAGKNRGEAVEGW